MHLPTYLLLAAKALRDGYIYFLKSQSYLLYLLVVVHCFERSKAGVVEK